MGNIEQIKHQLKNDLPAKGINHIVKSLKALLPENSPKYDLVIQLEADYKKHKISVIEGILSQEDKSREESLFDKRLLELINLLVVSDFDPTTKKSNLSEDRSIKKGHILYKVPQKMELQKESKCIVRIAFDKAMLVEDLDIDEDTKFKTDIRISDCMKVEIDDSVNPDAFDIRSSSELTQFIDQDDFTEWRFFVKPLLLGEHILEIRVSIMLEVNGQTRVRERVLEESVVIVTEEVKEEPEFKKMPESLLLAAGGVMVPSQNSQGSIKKGVPQVAKTLTMGLVFIIAFGGISYAFAPEKIDWWYAKYRDNIEAYEKYISKYRNENNEYLNTATKRICELKGEPEPCGISSLLENGSKDIERSLPIDSVKTDAIDTITNSNISREETEINSEEIPPVSITEETENQDNNQPNNIPNELKPSSINVIDRPKTKPRFEKLTPYIDKRDNKTYPLVRIGTQVWMAENLKFKTDESWCFDDNPENCEQLGRLYNWGSAKKICPDGWHLPNLEEWKILMENTGGYVEQYDRNNVKKIGNPKSSYETLIIGGESNFSARLNGYRTERGSSYKKGKYGYFWTNSTPSENSKTAFLFGFAKTDVGGMTFLDQYNKKDALSCRCIKD